MKTGFHGIDKLVNLDEGKLVVVGARPGMGKSALALNIAANVAEKDIGVILFSLDMSKEQIVKRVIVSESMVQMKKFKEGKLNEDDWKKLNASIEKIENLRLYIDDTSGISIKEIEEKSAKEKNIGLIIIDYVQLVSFDDQSKCLSRDNEIKEISIRLKELSRELNMPIVVLSQLSRKPEERENHRPILSDFTNSYGLVENADIVMFLYKDDYYNPDTELKLIGEVIICKNTDGKTGKVELLWLNDYLKFVNLEKVE